MILNRLYLFCFILFAEFTFAQQISKIEDYGNSIEQNRLQTTLTILASDSFLGRGTGKLGQERAAAFLSNYYKNLSIGPPPGLDGYFQNYPLVEFIKSGNLTINNQHFSYFNDFLIANSKFKFPITQSIPVYAFNSKMKPTDSCFVIIQISSTNIEQEFNTIKASLPNKAKGVIFLSNNYENLIPYFNSKSRISLYTTPKQREIPIVILNNCSETILKLSNTNNSWFFNQKKVSKKKQLNPLFTLQGELNSKQQFLTGKNVLAYIPGSDSLLSNETVVLSAHYDHLGEKEGEIYNGADDDGSGTVALMEIARVFHLAKQAGVGPKRSILFIHFSGEELGLFGSSFYTNNPIIPLSNTIANVNVDMIGRNDDLQPTDTNYIYIIGSNMLSNDLHQAILDANAYSQLQLDLRYNDKNDPNQYYYRSDHYNFAKNNIPSVFFFSGVHADYHQPSDDVEKIIFSKLKKVTQLIFFTTLKLANATSRPQLNHK